MLIHELTERECWEVLTHVRLGRLACSFRNQPYVVPIHAYLDGEHLYSFATLGKKVEWMRENPKVCVQFDDITGRFHWTTIVVFGRYEELLNLPGEDAQAARQKAHQLFRNIPEWWQPASSTVAPRDSRMPVIYRIHIDEITGRMTERPQGDTVRVPWWLDELFTPLEIRSREDT